MAPISWLGHLAGNVASIWGWSKPIMESAPMFNVLRNLPYFGNSDGVSPSASLGIIATPKVDILDGFAGNGFDEMSFDYLK